MLLSLLFTFRKTSTKRGVCGACCDDSVVEVAVCSRLMEWCSGGIGDALDAAVGKQRFGWPYGKRSDETLNPGLRYLKFDVPRRLTGDLFGGRDVGCRNSSRLEQ